MVATHRKRLEEYLAREYPFHVIAEPEGGYTIVFPDLLGCMTQVDRAEEIGPMAEDARLGWIETAYEHGMEIPEPSYPEEYSGKFNLRIPRSLHRKLAESAEAEGVSLNQYVTMLLGRADSERRLERCLDRLESQLDEIHRRLTYRVTGVPTARSDRTRLQVVPAPSELAMAV